MSNGKTAFQVVEVLGECRMRNGEDREHRYWRRDGRSLLPGFYVVHWPPGATVGRFNEDALFEGPFRERGGAEAALPRIVALVREDPSEFGRRHPERPIEVVDDRPPLRHRRPT